MTGFGKAEVVVRGKKIITEVKSLNSKQLDISQFRIPLTYKEKEYEIRNHLTSNLQRGKVDLYINVEVEEETSSPVINKSVFKSYYKQITEISKELELPNGEPLIQSILRLPDVFKSQTNEIPQDEWDALLLSVNTAVKNLNDFRVQEGNATQRDLKQKVEKILSLLSEIAPWEQERVTTVRERITESLKQLSTDISIDKNRLEQELIYYIEKIDINEEKARLSNHCKYFFDTLAETESVGRKLGFIAQEMGREINTLGSKANHVQIQKIVVQMKDELEKVKEQLLNVL